MVLHGAALQPQGAALQPQGVALQVWPFSLKSTSSGVALQPQEQPYRRGPSPLGAALQR